MRITVNQISQGRASKQDVQGPPAGSPFGSLVEGSAVGEEVKPALPIYGPQPEVAPYELPAGLQGDVVVEITIDAQGAVVQTSLVRGLGHGLDEKVLAVLQNWRFHPATRDGVAIPSRQDVYFHFPHA
jgi:protein TonB